jgi:hypothetical protein
MKSMLGNSSINWGPLGQTYTDIIGQVAPPEYRDYGGTSWMDDYQQDQQRQTQYGQQNADWKQRRDLYDKLAGSFGNFNSSASSRSYGGMIPQPSYASTGPIWNQQQINAQAGTQRAQMMAQAANQTRSYATSAAQRGFSPMSPLTQFMQQLSGQRANIGAAQNETNLNWNAAEGNRAAQQRGEGINAGLYGSYTSALARSRDQDMQAQAQGQSQKMEQYRLLAGLLGRG